jgi:hypothetical protein
MEGEQDTFGLTEDLYQAQLIRKSYGTIIHTGKHRNIELVYDSRATRL